jgi:hypothetical protein
MAEILTEAAPAEAGNVRNMSSTQPASVDSIPLREAFSWHAVLLFLAAAIALFSRFFRANTFGFFEDDFFYYVEVARNFARHGVSSFDGIHLTNGYHPLWMLLLAALLTFTSGKAFLIAVQAVTLAAIMVFYTALLRVLRQIGIDLALSRLAALVLSLHALLLFRYGMEVTLSLPLGVLTLAYILGPNFRWMPKQTIRYGLLACLTVLARLDGLILFALLLGLQTLASEAPWSERLKRIALYCIGFIPFLVYLAVNQHVFGIPMPVSAAAKQMKPLFPPSSAPLAGMFFPLDRMKAVFVLPALALLVCGAVALLRRRPSLRQRPVLLALLLFPAVHVSLLCLLSDWGVWPWYYYALVYSSLAAIAVLLQPYAGAEKKYPFFPLRAALLAPALFYVLYISVYAVKKQPSSIALIASDLAAYMQQHPGIYAMGDEAGTTEYLSAQPVIQLEGLTMDRAYLANIRQQRPLAEVLHDYHADYYIVLYAQRVDGCYDVHEPTNAGAASPHMLGRVCQPPLFTSTHSGSTASLFAASAVQ